jgi:type II secretory pathway component PulJ
MRRLEMADDEHVYGEVDNEDDLRQIFAAIRRDVTQATTREELTRLYRRAEYLIALTFSPAWQKKFGPQVEELRRVAEVEFTATARAINQRAAEIGTAPDYDETWGRG